MRVISATILDATHLELSQPLRAAPGEVIQISVSDIGSTEELDDWRQAGKEHFLSAYDDADAIYDEL